MVQIFHKKNINGRGINNKRKTTNNNKNKNKTDKYQMLKRKHSNNIRAIALEKKAEMKEESLNVFCLWISNND